MLEARGSALHQSRARRCPFLVRGGLSQFEEQLLRVGSGLFRVLVDLFLLDLTEMTQTSADPLSQLRPLSAEVVSSCNHLHVTDL